MTTKSAIRDVLDSGTVTGRYLYLPDLEDINIKASGHDFQRHSGYPGWQRRRFIANGKNSLLNDSPLRS